MREEKSAPCWPERPAWIKKRLIINECQHMMKRLLSELHVNTVCEPSLCPNLNECYSKKHAAFLILGPLCTRRCSFCSVEKGTQDSIDPSTMLRIDEPSRIAEAVKRLDLKYVVITSVTRDDLDDGGASEYARVVSAIRGRPSQIVIELLVPDFKAKRSSIERVLDSSPDIFGHNIETVERLYPTARPSSDYRRSLEVLSYAKAALPNLLVKSGMMLGLGETEEEAVRTIEDVREAGCDILTIGQYLRPTQAHLPVDRFVPLEEFEYYRRIGDLLGFRYVASGPFVRSSYMAEEMYRVTVLSQNEWQWAKEPKGCGESSSPRFLGDSDER